ncbi:hypothetical protein DM77_2949 [Burkholderia mallei]|nr:hypothetical protein DM77_2949 [Burkholderia mallei]
MQACATRFAARDEPARAGLRALRRLRARPMADRHGGRRHASEGGEPAGGEPGPAAKGRGVRAFGSR